MTRSIALASSTARQRSIAMAALLTAALGGCAGDSALTTPGAVGSATMTTGALAVPAKASPVVAEAPARKAATVKVGLMLPLSGPGQAALIADAMRKAGEMAVKDLNAGHVALLVRDDKATPEGAVAAAQDLSKEGSEIILGPLFARSVQAAAASARQANIPIVAFSNDRQVAGQGVTLLSFLAEPEVQRVVQYAAAQGKKRYAALIPSDSYGRLVEAAFRAAVARHGGEIVALETFQPEQANAMAETVRKLRDALRGIEEHGDAVDALFLPGGEETMASLMPQLKQAQFDFKRLRILGTGALDYANAGRDEQLQGAWFASPDPKGWQDFSTRFAAAHGHAPPRIASLAYDAVGLAAALSNGPDGARYIPSQLMRASGFSGIDGGFRLLPDGTVDRNLAILEVQAIGARVIDAATQRAAESAPRPLQASAAASASGVLSSIPSAFPPSN